MCVIYHSFAMPIFYFIEYNLTECACIFLFYLSEQNQLVQHNPKIGVIASSSDLALQSVQVHQAGNYSCIASNVEGDGESNTLELKVMCTYSLCSTI